MSFRSWLTIITLLLLSAVIFFGRNEIVHVWNLLGSVNLWILSLLIPIQLLSYFSVGNTIFSYLRSKGDLKDMGRLQMMRIALELNFVNHIIPSGGVSGFSYLSWLLSKHKVPVSRSTMAQIVRFVLFFLAFIFLLVIAMFMLAINDSVSNFAVVMSIALVLVIIVGVFLLIFIVEDKEKLVRFSKKLTKFINNFIRRVSLGHKKEIVTEQRLEVFFLDMHNDYLSIKHDKKILIRPFIWSILANIFDAGLIYVAFCALGVSVNPVLIFIAYGMAGMCSIISVTPGGAGVYETIMVTFLATSGVPASVAVAGTLLARVILLLGTIIFGYVFYQMTIMKYGKAEVVKSDE